MKSLITVLAVICFYPFHFLNAEIADFRLRQLSRAEREVMLHREDEREFSGIYYSHFKPGIYRCKQCNNLLYSSTHKFKSDYGWACFDASIYGNVSIRRNQLFCERCDGYLGTYTHGEKYTALNIRHTVNSLALNFEDLDNRKFEQSILAGGSFWGVQFLLSQIKGVITTEAGYSGGHVDHPTFNQVSEGKTGHAEAVRVFFDPNILSYEELLKKFFAFHNPTQRSGQGPDIGPQFRSEIFVFDYKQRNSANEMITKLQRVINYDLSTKITDAKKFWPASKEHQHYHLKNSSKPEWHSYKINIFRDVYDLYYYPKKKDSYRRDNLKKPHWYDPWKRYKPLSR